MQDLNALPTSSQPRRYIEAAAFVGVWMLLGWGLHLSTDAYLITGLPLLLLFQLVLRRRPLRELWIFGDVRPLKIDAAAGLLAVLLMALPVYQLFSQALPDRAWVQGGWLVLCAAGGAMAAMIIRNQAPAALRRGLPSFGAALLAGGLLMALSAVLNGRSALLPLAALPFLITQFLVYFAASFMMEEVAFRGGLDTHVAPGRPPAGGWASALFVSALWGLWHIPSVTQGGPITVDIVGGVLLVHILEGVPLSMCWRQSGSLLLPAAAHALIDAYRNAVMFM